MENKPFYQKHSFVIFMFIIGFISYFPWVIIHYKFKNSKDKIMSTLSYWSMYFTVLYSLLIGFVAMAFCIFAVTAPTTRINI